MLVTADTNGNGQSKEGLKNIMPLAWWGDIDVGDGCLRQNVSVTRLRVLGRINYFSHWNK